MGGSMKKLLTFILTSLVSVSLFAGDAAVFMDIGFSKDGKTYIFGQYGKLDKTYEAWAEIYTVDVASNNYVKNEVYFAGPNKNTVSLSGKKIYEDLKSEKQSSFAKYEFKPYSPANLLYVCPNEDIFLMFLVQRIPLMRKQHFII